MIWPLSVVIRHSFVWPSSGLVLSVACLGYVSLGMTPFYDFTNSTNQLTTQHILLIFLMPTPPSI